MKLKFKNIIFKKRFLFLLYSFLNGGSLAVLLLFNLPLFYEQDKTGSMKTFLIVFAIFSIVTFLSLKLLAIPIFYFRERNTRNIIFVVMLGLLIASIFHLSSSYYWTAPQYHRIDICYESDDPTEILDLYEIRDFTTRQIFPASSLGYRSYPVSISSGACIHGQIQALVKTNIRWEGAVAFFETKDEPDKVLIGINSLTTLQPLTNNWPVNGESVIVLNNGVEKGKPGSPIWSSDILAIIKFISLILGSIYLAFFISGVSELIIFHERFPSISHKTFLLIVLLYFIGFGFLMVNHGGQPDQGPHTYFSSRYSETWGIPKEDTSNFYVQHNEYLYYWINGAVVKIFHMFVHRTGLLQTDLVNKDLILTVGDQFLLRLLSLVMSTGTLIYIYKLTSKITGNRFAGTLAAFFCANTLMFVFISGGISYDNMMNLCSAAAIYHAICIWKQDDYVKHTALMGIWLSLGSISKIQVALLAFILFFVWLVYSIINRKILKFQFSRNNIILVAIFSITFGLFLQFYGTNLVEYHLPIPKCQQVKAPEYCTRFGYRASQRHEVDIKQLWTQRNQIIGPVEYAMNFWLFNMINGIWGIISHNTYEPKFLTSLHGCLIVWAVFCMVRYWNKDDITHTTLLFILLSYTGYVFLMNYNNELHVDFRHYAVQAHDES